MVKDAMNRSLPAVFSNGTLLPRVGRVKQCTVALRARHRSALITPGPIRRTAALDAQAVLHELLDGAGYRQRQAGLVGHLAEDLHVLEGPGEGHVVPVLQR